MKPFFCFPELRGSQRDADRGTEGTSRLEMGAVWEADVVCKLPCILSFPAQLPPWNVPQKTRHC